MAHLGGVLLAPLVAVVHMVLLRIYLVGEARRYLGPTRRLFTRWAARFAFLWLGLPGYAAMAAPLVGIVSGVATFVVLTGVIHVYTAWSLQRERRKAPLMLWEKALMTGLAVLTAAVIVALAVGGVLLGWSINALVERMASD
ncbi:MAG: hypothetical protein V2I67_03525 [Thermoanaerobaculales bacterium]|jgi:hypothetical protein|nr:hypothetical protein [Thermoanaerobaculales bacterium]